MPTCAARRCTTTFGCPLAPGLSNALVGEIAVSAAIHESGSDNLSILSAGTLPPNPPELLGSSPFAEILKAMSERFDWVVLDSPPVRAVADAAIIAHLATTVVFVVGSEMTDGNSAQVRAGTTRRDPGEGGWSRVEPGAAAPPQLLLCPVLRSRG